MTTYYYPDKLLMAKGQSRLDITKDGKRHWYKFEYGMNMTQKVIYFGLNITKRVIYTSTRKEV